MMDETDLAVISNMDGGFGAAFDQKMKIGEPYKDRIIHFARLNYEGINEPGWSEKAAAELERCFKRGAGSEDLERAGAHRQESRRHLHSGRRPAARSDLGNVRALQQAGHDSHQRFVRPLPADRPGERALRSRPVAQRSGRQLLQDRASEPRGDREGAREHARQASQDALRQRALSRCCITTWTRSRRCSTSIPTPISRLSATVQDLGRAPLHDPRSSS